MTTENNDQPKKRKKRFTIKKLVLFLSCLVLFCRAFTGAGAAISLLYWASRDFALISKPHFRATIRPGAAPPFLPAMARSWAHFAMKNATSHGGLRDMSRFLPMAFLASGRLLTLSTVTWGFDPCGPSSGRRSAIFSQRGRTRGRRQHNPQQLIKQLLLTSGGKLYPQDERRPFWPIASMKDLTK